MRPPSSCRRPARAGSPSSARHAKATSFAITTFRPRTRSTLRRGPRAFVDWDLAAPGPRLWDVAYAAYRFTPLYPDEALERLGIPIVPRGTRLRILCDAYGLAGDNQLLDPVEARILSLYETARERGEAGEPGWREVWRDTRGRQWLTSLEFVRRHRASWEHELAPGSSGPVD